MLLLPDVYIQARKELLIITRYDVETPCGQFISEALTAAMGNGSGNLQGKRRYGATYPMQKILLSNFVQREKSENEVG